MLRKRGRNFSPGLLVPEKILEGMNGRGNETMEHLHLEWMDRNTGSLRPKLVGAALGLFGGLFFGGIVLPSRFLTAPLTAIAAAAAVAIVEQWLANNDRVTFLPVRAARLGGVAGLATGAALGLVVGASYAALAYARGAVPLVALQALFTIVEIGAISGFAGLIVGFGQGISEARD